MSEVNIYCTYIIGAQASRQRKEGTLFEEVIDSEDSEDGMAIFYRTVEGKAKAKGRKKVLLSYNGNDLQEYKAAGFKCNPEDGDFYEYKQLIRKRKQNARNNGTPQETQESQDVDARGPKEVAQRCATWKKKRMF